MSSEVCNFTPASCKDLIDVRIALGEGKQRLDNFEIWQKAQNGSLARINGRLDRVYWFLLTIMASSLGTLAMVLLSVLGVIKL